MKHYLLLCIIFVSGNAFAQSFYQLENTTIPDDGTSITFEMTVSGLPDVIDLSFGLESVCFNINHTWTSDLDITLIAPDGSSFVLVSGVGWGEVNFENTCLNDYADQFISEGFGPYTGVWKPIGDMGVINNGQNPNGIWKIYIYDTYAFADIGELIDWTITFGDEPAAPFAFSTSNLPIIKINSNGATIVNEPKVEADFFIIDNGLGAENGAADTNYAYAGKILVELQGFTGPYYPKKNYDFDLIDSLGFEVDSILLGLPSENDFNLKAEYLDYSLLKNALTYEMARRMGRYAPRTKYCELIINGEYMGVFSLTEKIKRDENRVDIAQLNPEDIIGEELTGGYIFEINENFTPNDWESDYLPINFATNGLPVAYKMVYPRIEDIQPEQLDYIVAYVDSFEDALNGPDFLDEATGYRNYISVKSFVDFMLVNEFSSNFDSYGRSTFLYKDKNDEINIGPAWDYDRAYAPWTVAGWVWEITHPAWPFPFWWSKLREDEEWRNEAYCRYTNLRASILTDDAFDMFIDSAAAYINEGAVRNFEKWPELGVTDYDYFVEELRTFVHDRLAWMDVAFAPDFVPAPNASFEVESVSYLTQSFIPATTDATYLWNFGDGTTSTEEFPIHTYASPGDYVVSLTVNQYYGCLGNSNSTIEIVASIADNLLSQIAIYPNPVITTINIILPQAIEINEIQLFNVQGDLMSAPINYATTQISIDMQDLAPGAYLIKIKSGVAVINYPIVKQ